MLMRLADALARWVERGLWLGFTALIVTVALQVVSRNIIKVPLIWTLDVAQLLFSWLVFVGAAVAWRKGAHYTVDVVPPGWRRFRLVLDAIGIMATLLVVYVLVVPGSQTVAIRSTGLIPSLDISLAWTIVPLPIAGVLMFVFLLESMARHLGANRDSGGARE